MNLRYRTTLVVLIWLLLPITMMQSALAVTPDAAKKCQALSAKAFPPRIPGNPAAGLMNGTGREASEYFRKCIENGGDAKESEKQQPSQKKQ